MIVMKFGGTSIQDVAAIDRVAAIIKERLTESPVLVCSAMGKTTANLLEAASFVASGKVDLALKKLDQIRNYHLVLAYQVIPELEQKPVWTRLTTYLNELQKLFEGLSILRDLTPQSRDKILSYGELISTTILSDALIERGIPALLLDSRNLVITDNTFTSAQPILELTESRIKKYVGGAVAEGKIPVLQGYIGSTRDGHTTTLGFEGSDYTATLVASALDASEVQIWKTVAGLMTSDPGVNANSRTVKSVSYEEAAELTFFGAKCLHSKAIYPARKKKIPVRILNTLDSKAEGTLISEAAVFGKNTVKSITYLKGVTLLSIERSNGTSTYNFLRAILDFFDRSQMTPLLMNTTEGRAMVALNLEEVKDFTFDELKKWGEVSVKNKLATISLIGENVRTTLDFPSRVLECIRDYDILKISHGASPINLSIVIEDHHVSAVIDKLHREFFKELDPEVFL